MRYRIFTWADITACIIVIALLLFVFIYPYCLSRDYYELFYDKQQRVLECTREENWGEAHTQQGTEGKDVEFALFMTGVFTF